VLLPGRPDSRRVISRRGAQLAAATVLGTVVVLAVLGVILLGAYEIRCYGLSDWIIPYSRR
jgi:hypothetical protein